MKRWMPRLACLIGVLLLTIGVRTTGRAQSFAAVMYLPTIRYLHPCAAVPIPMITRPPTPERLAFFHSNYQSPPGTTPDLYMTNADNTQLTRLTNDSATEGRPTWSPDGTRIAYVRLAAQSATLRVLQLSNQRTSSIYTWKGGAWIADPAWSPDGKQIAFTLYPAAYSGSNIGIIQANGTNLRSLTNTGTDTWPSWSPDGSRIVFASQRLGISHLYLMHADGTQQIQLTNQPVRDYQPAWSPDGSQIAFTSECASPLDGEPDSIYTIQADGSGRMHIPIQEGFGSGVLDSQMQPSWSPDSTQIAYTQNSSKGSNILIVNLDGSSISWLGLSPDSAPSWAPR